MVIVQGAWGATAFLRRLGWVLASGAVLFLNCLARTGGSFRTLLL